jgi:hypothetical protein
MTAPFPSTVTDGCSLTVRYTTGGQQAVNVLGGKINGPFFPTPANVQTWLDAWWGQMRSIVSPNLTCLGAQYRDLSVADGGTLDVAPSGSPTGTNGGGISLAAASYLIAWRTASGGRSGRGRTFLPGVPEEAVEPGGVVLQEGNRAGVTSRAGLYIAAMQPGNGPIQAAVISRRLGLARPILSASTASTVGVQRRRMR